MDYSDYKQQTTSRIIEVCDTLSCQPVLFIGAGFSKRLNGLPSWSELLDKVASKCPEIDKDYAYYAQKFDTPQKIGSHFSTKFHTWAWQGGRNSFPEEFYSTNETKREDFFKHAICHLIDELQAENKSTELGCNNEVLALQKVTPHAVVTTNFDTVLEKILPNYDCIIGQSLLGRNFLSVGEIIKLHGCITDHRSLILTEEDYIEFSKKRKYMSAKLLTMFSEHPLLIMGYSVQDENIKSILSDIDEALGTPGSLIENIFFVDYLPEIEAKSSYKFEHLIQVTENRSVRVNCIQASDFSWIFEAFASQNNPITIPVKFLRQLMARSYELVRIRNPKKLEVNYDLLERKLENSEEFAQLFGISTLSNASYDSGTYLYTSNRCWN